MVLMKNNPFLYSCLTFILIMIQLNVIFAQEQNYNYSELKEEAFEFLSEYHKGHLSMTNKILGDFNVADYTFVGIGRSPTIVNEYIRQSGGEVYEFPVSRLEIIVNKKAKTTGYDPVPTGKYATDLSHEKIVETFAVNIEKRIPHIRDIDKPIVLIDYANMGYSIADIHYFFEEGLKYIGIEERRTRVFQVLMKSPFNPIPRMNPVYDGLPFSRLKIFNLSPKLSEMYAGHAFKSFSPYESFRIVHDPEKNYNSPQDKDCLLYTSPSPRDRQKSRMPSSA